MTCCWEKSSNLSKKFRLTTLASQPVWTGKSIFHNFLHGVMNNPDELLNQRRLYQNASLCGGTFALLYNPFQLPKMTMACHSSLRISDLQRVLPNTGWFFYPLRMCVRAVDVSVYEWAKIVTWFFFYVVCFEGHLNRSTAIWQNINLVPSSYCYYNLVKFQTKC